MKNVKLVLSLASLLTLAACTQESTPPPAVTANVIVANVIVATVAADYSSGAHSVISRDDNNVRIALNELSPTASDITVAAFGSHFYRIERAFAGNNIIKFSSSDPQTAIWQYSTNDAGSAVSSNPYDMIFVSETKAYVLRYGTTKAWIVNPSASTEAEFKTGELDLTAYADSDGIPEMAGGIIVDGKLYITLQRLENYAVTQTAYIAIFDVATDQEIDANIAGDALKGIPLLNRNPTAIVYEATSNTIFVQSSGSFFPMEYTGGIEKIELSDLTPTLVLDDGDAGNHPYGLITELAVISKDVLYFVGYAGFTDNTLYQMDLTTGTVTATTVSSLINAQIAYITVDVEGLLWVSDSANATVRIIDPADDSEVDALLTSLNPDKIVFAD